MYILAELEMEASVQICSQVCSFLENQGKQKKMTACDHTLHYNPPFLQSKLENIHFKLQNFSLFRAFSYSSPMHTDVLGAFTLATHYSLQFKQMHPFSAACWQVVPYFTLNAIASFVINYTQAKQTSLFLTMYIYRLFPEVLVQ